MPDGLLAPEHQRRANVASQRSSSRRPAANFDALVAGTETVRRWPQDPRTDPGVGGEEAGSPEDHGSEHHSPEQALWRAVVAMAWRDAFGPRVYHVASPETEVVERAEARSFLVADEGSPWGDGRIAVCCMADICPDRLRRRALEELEDRATVERDLEALARREETLDPERADKLLEELVGRERHFNFFQ